MPNILIVGRSRKGESTEMLPVQWLLQGFEEIALRLCNREKISHDTEFDELFTSTEHLNIYFLLNVLLIVFQVRTIFPKYLLIETSNQFIPPSTSQLLYKHTVCKQLPG